MNGSEILNIFLGGGFLALLVGVITLRATVRKANADAERAKADAESVRITNTENATRILVENIVKPLKEELNATREDLQATKREMASTKREMARLRKAVESASGCPHSAGCPVLVRMRSDQKDGERERERDHGDGEGPYRTEKDRNRHGGRTHQGPEPGDDPGEPGGDDDPP